MSLFGDELESIHEFDPLTGHKTDELEFVKIYANSHYVTPRPTLMQAIQGIKLELRAAARSAQRRTGGCSKRSGSSSARSTISK